MMIAARRFLFAAGCFGIVAAADGALAQPMPAPPTDSNISLSAPGLLLKKPPPGLPPVKPQLLVWPRLDAGAVLCRSEDDLDRLAARRRGDPVDGPIDCQIVRVATGVTIVQRISPGKTEVRTNDPRAGGSGWTDVWLPDKAPPRATSASR